MLLHQGGIIKEKVNAELDELRAIAFSGKDYLSYKFRSGKSSERNQFIKNFLHKVFGYYLEVSNANKDKVPTDWIRKQTLVNAERFITEELKFTKKKSFMQKRS